MKQGNVPISFLILLNIGWGKDSDRSSSAHAYSTLVNLGRAMASLLKNKFLIILE